MTESSIFTSGNSQQSKPGMKKQPAEGRGALAFNPLHPSMELPPEQLIRLLGMESKKTRKHMKVQRSPTKHTEQPAIKKEKIQQSADEQHSHRATEENELQISQELQQPAPIADKQDKQRKSGQQKPEPQPVAVAPHPMEYERNTPPVFEKRIPGWLLPAMVVGLVAGVTVSGFLFWFQSPSAVKQKAPAPLVSSESRHRQTPKQQANNQPVKRKATSDGGETAKAKAQAKAQAEAQAQAQAQAPAKTVPSVHDANWQAAIEAEQQRLRSDAEQRLNGQLARMEASRELADLQAPPASELTPATATLPAAAKPATAKVASPSTRDAAVTPPESDTSPAVTPAQAVVSADPDEIFETSPGLPDSAEQAPAPEHEQGSVVSDSAVSLKASATTAMPASDEVDSVSDTSPEGDQAMETGQNNDNSAAENPASF